MSTRNSKPPPDEAAAFLAEVQWRTLRGVFWILLGFAIVQMAFWHLRLDARRTWISYTFESLLVGGLAAQALAIRRCRLRTNGWIFVTWIGLIDAFGWTTAGAEIGIGVAIVCTILGAIFFIGRTAGVAVVAAFFVVGCAHAYLRHAGVVPFSPGWPETVSTASQARSVVISTLLFATCCAAFTLIHRALHEALARMNEERAKRDVAERTRSETEATMLANQHFESLGKLASGVAHDVNNALTAVLCNAELLQLALPPGEERDRTDDIVAAGLLAAQTTRQLLSYSRRGHCQPMNTLPAESVQQVTRLANRLLAGNVRVQVDVQNSRRILVDPADLQQALLNLIINARDAMPQGGEVRVQVRDSAGPTPADSGQVHIHVQDTGRGIAPEIIARVYEPFFTTKPVGKGTGLGLTMVKAFVDEAGGTIEIRSTVGTGTTVTLTFPETRTNEVLADSPTTGQRDFHGKRILLAEHQDALRKILHRVLVRAGYAVTAAGTIAEAQQEISAGNDFDLLCVDGIEDSTSLHALIDQYRRHHDGGPVLLCSGNLNEELVQGRIAALAVNFLRKPFTGTELVAHVQSVLANPSVRPPLKSNSFPPFA